MELFREGKFTLSSGQESDWLIDCDALGDESLRVLARLLAERLPMFNKVEGVPRGGLRLAKEMEKYTRGAGTLLLVDDVWTTGGSWDRHRAGREAVGAVLFARAPVPLGVVALFELHNPWAWPAAVKPVREEKGVR